MADYMADYKKQNAVIKSTFLGREDHGILTFGLELDYGGSRQSAGNLALHGAQQTGRDKEYMTFAILADVLKVVGVDCWEQLPGRNVVALIHNGIVKGIENFLGTSTMLWEEYQD